MEWFFGLIGVASAATFIIISALVTPNYNPLYHTVSSLGQGIAKNLFSIGFVAAGSLGIPFYIYLEITLKETNKFLRRCTTGIAIFTCLCIAFVGILPDPDYPYAFVLFHGFVAVVAFGGSSFYIVLYSFLMSRDKIYPKALTVIGYLVGATFIVFLLFLLVIKIFSSLVEWILTISILVWILSVAIYTIFAKHEKLYHFKN